MKLFKAVLLCLVLCVGAWGFNYEGWLASCRNSLSYIGLDDNQCAPLLKQEATKMLEKKIFKYSLVIAGESVTKQEEKAIKKAIESALLRYFSTPAYPKKIKEVNRDGKELEDMLFVVKILKYNDTSGIYYGDISEALSISSIFGAISWVPIAFYRETQFNIVGDKLDYEIKELSTGLFKAINE